MRVEGERVGAVAHRVRGCALVAASASLLAEMAPGGYSADALGAGRRLREWLLGRGPLPLGMDALVPVQVFPARARCVPLPWDALALAMEAPG